MRRITIGLAVAALVACGELKHENPYDPETPAGQQARTSFSGTVSLEAVGGVTPSLAGIPVSVAGQSWSATTNETGQYTITGVPPGSYTIQAVLADYETAAVPGVVATLDTGGSVVSVPALALRRVRADLAGTVQLRLPDDQLEATGGARISIAPGAGPAAAGGAGARVAPLAAGSSTALTDGDGAYLITDLPAPIGSYTLTASKYGYVTQTSAVTFQDGAFVVQTVQLVIDPGALVGTVAVAGAADAFGVTVRARGSTVGGSPWEQVTTTDAAGAFRISGLPAGTYTVSYERADLVTTSTSARVVRPGEDTLLEAVTLNPATGSIRGVVALAGAASSAGVIVTASGPGSASTVTDAAGAFTLGDLPVGSYSVVARKDPDWQAVTTTGVTVARDAATTVATATLSPWATASIGGTVLLEGGAAPAGSTATLSGADFRGVAVNATATTGSAGEFTFPGLRAGSYQVVFSRASYDTPASVGASVSTGQAVALGTTTLAASRGAAAGVVTATGAASQAGTVVIVSGGPDTASAVTDAAGAWTVSGLRVGTGYVATYERAAYASSASAAFAVTSGATTPVPAATLALATTGSLEGTVAVERGSAAGVTVSLSGTDVNGAAVPVASTTTGAGGTWAIGGLRQGTYALTFTKAGYDPGSLSGLAVAAGAVTAPGVTLSVSLGTVAGTVALSAGSIVNFAVGTDFSGVVVTLEGADLVANPVPPAVTDASGSYRFENVPVSLTGAAYTVTASKTWFTSDQDTVTAQANASVSAPAMSLPVAAGALTGLATLTNVPGGGDGLPSADVLVSISGTAFNGTSFTTTATSATSGVWTSLALPPGTYDVVATATDRTCGAYERTVVGSGIPTDAGTVLCLDAVAPSGLVLAAPVPAPPQQAGYTPAPSLAVTVVTPATDVNLSHYELAIGASPDWATAAVVAASPAPASLTFGGLAADARNVLWARAVDTAGNAGAASSLEVIQDSQDPPTPTLSTARAVVDDTSTTVTISGSEGDASFYGYQAASTTIAATGTCSATTGAAFTASPAGAAVSLTANQKTCFYARAVDRAGRLSPQRLLAITSDLTPPTSPTIAPLYDPSLLTVHAEYVDFFVTAAAQDAPAGGNVDWRNVAWVEVDTGTGYRPLCPSSACRPLDGLGNPTYAPCSCGCSDDRLVCDGATFKAIRVPLLDGTSSSVGIRAVDLAGNVGSGATQLVATSTGHLPVATTSASETNPRGRGRLLGYRYTDVYLRLRDLGDDGRPDASDVECNLGSLGTVVSRVAVLGPRVVVHGDGNQTIMVRRPGTDGLFCTGDDPATPFTLYTQANGAITIRNVTGTFAYAKSASARTRELAAWVERNGATDTVMVQGPNLFGTLATPPWPFSLPAPVALFSGSSVKDLLEGGDCLLTSFNSGSFRVDCKAGGVDNATGVTRFDLPAGAIAATLSSDGLRLAWLQSVAGAPELHVLRAGDDRLYGTGDDVEVRRVATGAAPAAAEMALDGSLLVVSETCGGPGCSSSSSTYWLLHWSAGPDGVFDDADGADDTVTRVLPSSVPRFSPTVLAGGIVAYGTFGMGINLADIVASDLSTYRWEAIEAAGFDGLATNGQGTLFFHRGSNLTARLPDGSEQQGGFYASSFAASGPYLVTIQGSTVYRRTRSGSSWFGGAATAISIAAGTPQAVAAGDRWALIQASGNRYYVADLSAPTPTSTLLPVVAGTTPGNNGFGISDTVVAYQCSYSGWNACFHHPGSDLLFGTGDDVTGVIRQPTNPYAAYPAYGVVVEGDKVIFADGLGGGSGQAVVVATGRNGVFATADYANSDDTYYVLGSAASAAAGTLTVAGDYAAWLQIPVGDGFQVRIADLAKGTQRQVTSHYSMKESLAIDPSGRVTWIDYGLSVPAIFTFAP